MISCITIGLLECWITGRNVMTKTGLSGKISLQGKKTISLVKRSGQTGCCAEGEIVCQNTSYRSGCLVCGAELVYYATAREETCVYCGQTIMADAACIMDILFVTPVTAPTR
jgi:hypothetical protein